MPFGLKAFKSKPRRWDYAAYLAQRIRQGHYHPVFRDYLRAFSHRTANFILHLLNVAKGRPPADGFIQATERFVEDGIALSTEDQAKILAWLESKGIAEVERRGRPPMRYIRLNTDAIERYIARKCGRATASA
ncbi:MAG TPA: hypothetical protein VG013_13950 [Gemmataceae bacterium]|jgi:hypothetical protein|nr:hypothetical protein [Gemmataceae bacterium]